ncbi:MAG: extracellular solute-binding protein [Microthrixaceae bacterium]
MIRVALVGGPMYDGLYGEFGDDVEIVVHADHLSLNERVARLLEAGERLDVISTHGKYAPSQRQWLHPLDDLLAPETIAAMEPGAVSLCSDRGELLCIPRNVDVRVLWWRTDRMDSPPDTWEELVASKTVFGFTGRGSGLFGLFFELVVGRSGRLFDAHNQPDLDSGIAVECLKLIAKLAERCPGGPDGLASWHYDEVDSALCAGVADCSAAWPGATHELRSSSVGQLLRPAPYPAGPQRRVSYSGCHGWAIPRTCGDLDSAVRFVERLSSVPFQRLEASVGGIPARGDVLAEIQASDHVDAARLAATRLTIAESMITYPALERFPRLEDTGSAAITDLILGRRSIDDVVEVIQRELALVTE